MITTVSLAQAKQLCHVDELADDRELANAGTRSAVERAVARRGTAGAAILSLPRLREICDRRRGVRRSTEVGSRVSAHCATARAARGRTDAGEPLAIGYHVASDVCWPGSTTQWTVGNGRSPIRWGAVNAGEARAQVLPKQLDECSVTGGKTHDAAVAQRGRTKIPTRQALLQARLPPHQHPRPARGGAAHELRLHRSPRRDLVRVFGSCYAARSVVDANAAFVRVPRVASSDTADATPAGVPAPAYRRLAEEPDARIGMVAASLRAV